jgi:hypothetical protein
MEEEKQGFRWLSWRTAAIVWVLAGIGAIIWLISSITTDPEPLPSRGIAEDRAYVTLYQRLIDTAVTPEAKEYVSLLFELPASSAIDVSLDVDLDAWRITVEGWPDNAVPGLDAAGWFSVNAVEHLDTLGEPVWVVYEYGRVLPTGGALVVEADIARLNEDRRID